jgi:uncharacterized Fe-S cluster-containing radical SAM superfamily protein
MKKPALYPAIQMTSACNKRCISCLRPPEEKRHSAAYRDLKKYFEDLKSLSAVREIGYQFVTGGEPTLWRDQEVDIVDILVAFHRLGFIGLVTMPTNGKRFEDRDYARDFVKRLSAQTERPTVVGLSIATYQNNLIDKGCVALDNLISACARDGGKVVPIVLVTLSVNDDTYQRLGKLYPQVAKRVTALAPLGVASGAPSQCPSLFLNSSDKTPLGSFLPHFKRDVTGKLRLSEASFYAMPNGELIDKLSLFNNCSASPFIDDRWRFCLPFREDGRFDLGALGSIEGNTIDRFLEAYSAVGAIRNRGVISAAKSYKSRLSKASAEKLDEVLFGNTPVSVAYRGCMVCKKLGEIGVLDEMLALGN